MSNEKNKKERTVLLLDVEEEKVYYRYVGEHSQRPGHLGESRVMTLSLVRKQGREGNQVQQLRAKGTQRDRYPKYLDYIG